MDVNAAGDVWLAGGMFGSMQFAGGSLHAQTLDADRASMFVVKLNGAGEWLWGRVYDSAANQAFTQVRVDADRAGIVVSVACQDVGNGTRTVLAKVVDEVLGVAPASLRIEIGDSNFVPGPMAGGSRTTASVVPAAVGPVTCMRLPPSSDTTMPAMIAV